MDIAYMHTTKGVSGVMLLTLMKGTTGIAPQPIGEMISTTETQHLVSHCGVVAAPPMGPEVRMSQLLTPRFLVVLVVIMTPTLTIAVV